MPTDRHIEFRKWLESQRQQETESLDKALEINPPHTEVIVAWYSVSDPNGTYHVSPNCEPINNTMLIRKANLDFATAESIDAFNKVPGRKADHKFNLCGVCDQEDVNLLRVRPR